MERVCLEEAALSSMDLARSGLLQVAEDCRAAADEIEARLPRTTFAWSVQGLLQALAPTRPSRKARSN